MRLAARCASPRAKVCAATSSTCEGAGSGTPIMVDAAQLWSVNGARASGGAAASPLSASRNWMAQQQKQFLLAKSRAASKFRYVDESCVR